MIIPTSNGSSLCTDKDLTDAERHILQKLFIWETMAASIEQFRHEKERALACGWNNSGPVKERECLKMIISDLEAKVIHRLKCGGNV